MSDYSRSIILVPTLNEKENLKDLIPGIFGLMPDISVLIVDDNSQDGTSELLSSLSYANLFSIRREADFGYGIEMGPKGLQVYVYGGVPPFTVAFKTPSQLEQVLGGKEVQEIVKELELRKKYEKEIQSYKKKIVYLNKLTKTGKKRGHGNIASG